jgi:4-diphosphocytidyl-2-C-methyl-D-erythritol kinase
MAIRLFREASGLSTGGITARLSKAIPPGAGLGGGSSDAVSALKALRQLFGLQDLNIDWIGLAGTIGSDCPLFFSDRPVIMEGRGEQIRPLDNALAARFRGKPVILFKPRFSINTGEAYRRLAAEPFYQPAAAAQADMAAWEKGTEPLPPRNNDFERLVEDWIPSLGVVLARLRIHHGLEARMSGSGSACFIFPNQASFARKVIEDELTQAFGEDYWFEETAFD